MIDLDAIRARLSRVCFSWSSDNVDPPLHEDLAAVLAYVDALREAAGKVTCKRCAPANPGVLHEFYTGKPYPAPTAPTCAVYSAR